MLMGDMGAMVVKVERPGGGDESRAWGPPWSGGMSTYYQAVNRNKRSAVCDLASPEGRISAHKLIARADVVVENFRAGTMDGFGLGPAELLQAKPDLIYCSITGFGRDAGAQMPGYDFLIQAVGGLMSITGVPDGEPLRVGVAVVDVITGLHALAGILAALRYRDETGRGQHIEVSLMTSLLSALINQASGYLNAGVVPRAMGNQHPSLSPYELVKARDRDVALAIGNDAQFEEFCDEVGVPDLAVDPRFRTNAVRVENRDALVTRINAALESADASEWIARLTERGVPCGAVNRLDEAIELAGGLGLHPDIDMISGLGQVSRQVRHPVSFSASPATYRYTPSSWDQVVSVDELLKQLDSDPGRAGRPD
jgi:crotonobetainyl-CoA:carnitine CoA-transferase CaiB-like acyl-CoA transferase